MFNHIPVLLNETIDGLNIKCDGIYVDLTLGGGGHANEVLKKLNNTGLLIGFDQDIDAINNCKEKFKSNKNVIIIKDNFENFDKHLKELNINKVDGIYADLGVSSHQFDEGERGFSYNQNYKLDMRMDKSNSLSAYEVVNNYSEEELFKIIKNYSDEKFAKNIAKHICIERQKKKIENSFDLVDIIKMSIPAKLREHTSHPAKRTFQAIRIEVNKELEVLNTILEKIPNYLNDNGRLCIITFHSLEDKLVKNAFKKYENPCTCPIGYPCVCGKKSLGKIITKKALIASNEELELNRRAQSAKLRIFERMNNV